jgi:hypothetical protein
VSAAKLPKRQNPVIQIVKICCAFCISNICIIAINYVGFFDKL